MKVKLYNYNSLDKDNEELDLIIKLCKFEEIQYDLCNQTNKDFNKYYCDNSIVIVIVNNNRNYCLRGFWNFVDFLLTNRLIINLYEI